MTGQRMDLTVRELCDLVRTTAQNTLHTVIADEFGTMFQGEDGGRLRLAVARALQKYLPDDRDDSSNPKR